jgi:uncharacterized protein YigE (DUF2233 family)
VQDHHASEGLAGNTTQTRTRFKFPPRKTLAVAVTPQLCHSDDEGLGKSPTGADGFEESVPINVTTFDGGDRGTARRVLKFGAVRSNPNSPPRSTAVATTPASGATVPRLAAGNNDYDNAAADSTTLFDGLRLAARAEQAAAHFNTARALHTPNADSVELAKVISHYTAAAMLGHTKSKVNLAQLYFTVGDTENFGRAKRLLAEACRERDAVALAFVGAAYRTGTGPLGVRRDPHRAARILRTAVNLGNPDAMLQLSLQLSAGDGVKQSEVEAFELCRHAAQFRASAQRRLAEHYRDGCGVDADASLSFLYSETARINADAVARARAQP